MNRLEDALRETFDSDLTTTEPPSAPGVRAAVRRRRTTRAVVGATAAVTLVAVAAASLGLRDGDRTPAPTPSPTPAVTDAPGALASALAVESAGGALFATTDDAACGCSVLVRRDGDRWTRLHAFPVPYVDRLALTPDGRDGWAAADGRVWSTHDGGSTWQRVQLPSRADGDFTDSYLVAASSSYAWLVNLADDSLWRSPVGTDTFEQHGVPVEAETSSMDTRVWDVRVIGDSVVADLTPTEEGEVTSAPKTADEKGIEWEDLPRPCAGDTRLLSSDDAVFVVCPDAGEPEATVYRWRPGERGFTGFSNAPLPPGADVVPLSADRVLVLGAQDRLLTEGAAVAADLPRGPDTSAWDAVVLDDRTYLATTDGLYESTDGGRSWRRI